MFGKHTQEMEEKGKDALEMAQEKEEKAAKGAEAQGREALAFFFFFVFYKLSSFLHLKLIKVKAAPPEEL